MARIRSIKPEFPHSETIGSLSRDARLLFIMLWTIVDDEGRARAASRLLASLLFPYDDDAPGAIEGWLGELEREGCIRRYEVEGSRYLDIPNWLKHQKIDKPTKSKLPPFGEGSRGLANGRDASATDLGPRIRDQDQDQDHSEADASAAPAAQPPPEPTIPDPSIEERDYFRRAREVLGPTAGSVAAELRRAKGGNIALARAALEEASTKHDPREYLAACIRQSAKPRGRHVPETGSLADFTRRQAERFRQAADSGFDFGAAPLPALAGR